MKLHPLFALVARVDKVSFPMCRGPLFADEVVLLDGVILLGNVFELEFG